MGIVQGSIQISLGSLHRDFQYKKVLLPDWQRDLIWTNSKIKKWQEDIEKGGNIPGVIITFNIKGDTIKYLNDGAQRTLSTQLFVIEREKDMTENEISHILDNCIITKQHIEYESMKEAFLDFFRINQGTICTPYELGKGILSTNLKNFENTWQPILHRLHKIGESCMSMMKCAKPKGREKWHKNMRDDYALFLRFVELDKSDSDYNSGLGRLDRKCYDDEKTLQKILEYRLQKWCNENGIESCKKQLDLYERFLYDNIAMYENTWRKIINIPGIAPTPCNLRWFLAVSIYRRNNDISIDKFEEFTEKYIKETQGGSGLRRRDNNSASKEISSIWGRKDTCRMGKR